MRWMALQQASAAAHDIARMADSPCEVLSSVYEDLLRYRPTVDPRTGRFQLRRCDDGRKANGSFYTPRPVARRIVAEALRPLGDRNPPGALFLPLALDPAMGTGVFLLEVVCQLAEYASLAGIRVSRPALAEHCVYGIDSDPLAVQLAIHSLCLETGARPGVLARHLRRGDLLSLREDQPTARFDVVLGNPPWGVRYDPAERERLMERFPRSTRGTFDSCKLFLDLGSRLSRGTLGMVTPQAVLAQATHADIREVLLERMDPYFAMNLGDKVFPGAAAPACALVFGPKPGPAVVRCVPTSHIYCGAANVRVPATLWSAERGFLLARAELLDLFQRLQRRHASIGRLSHLFRIRDVGINYNRASVARRVLYTGTTAEDARDIPRYRGRDFARYTSIGVSGWVRHDPQQRLLPGETLSVDWATYRLPEKVVLRQTADRIVATLDRTRMAMGRSVIAITGEAGISLRALLACLNSRLLTVLYRALAGEEGRVLPQVKVGRIRVLPLPEACVAQGLGAFSIDVSFLEAEALLARAQADPLFAWVCLDRLAALLLTAEGRDAALDSLVDQIVYRLYGLSPDEIALMETT